MLARARRLACSRTGSVLLKSELVCVHADQRHTQAVSRGVTRAACVQLDWNLIEAELQLVILQSLELSGYAGRADGLFKDVVVADGAAGNKHM